MSLLQEAPIPGSDVTEDAALDIEAAFDAAEALAEEDRRAGEAEAYALNEQARITADLYDGEQV